MTNNKIKEKAIKYYPTLWSKEWIYMLVPASLTPADYEEITSEVYIAK